MDEAEEASVGIGLYAEAELPVGSGAAVEFDRAKAVAEVGALIDEVIVPVQGGPVESQVMDALILVY